MLYLEEKGQTVEEALEKALKRANISHAEAVYEVIRDGSTGGPAIIRLYTEIPELETIEKIVTEFFGKLVGKINVDIMPKRTKYYVNVHTQRFDSLLIGKAGKTLDAINHIINLIIRKKYPEDKNVKVEIDISGYKERKRQFLINKTLAVAKRVKETGREMRMDPLSPKESRIVKNVLKKEKGVRYYTIDRGEEKVLVIAPERK